MTHFGVRACVACALVAGWAVACSGSSFNASSGGGSGTGGALSSGGSAQAGSVAQAGSSEAGSSQAGTSAGGSGAGESGGGAGQSGSGQGGHAASGSGGVSSGGSVSMAGGAGSAGSAGAGGVRNSGDCDTDKSCGTNATCQALSVGGFRTCVVPVPAPTTCGTNDACCANDPTKSCSMGTCVAGPLSPSCGGLVTAPSNVCAVSQCSTGTDCSGSNAICVPAGALGRKANTCLTGGCRRDSECTAEAGGKCEPVTGHCCNGVTGLYCVYPTTGCRAQADCTSGTCEITNNRADCVMGSAVCPG